MAGSQPDPGPTDPVTSALFAMADNVRQLSDALEGQVTHLKGNGWTDDQARAIVACSFGWRPPQASEGSA